MDAFILAIVHMKKPVTKQKTSLSNMLNPLEILALPSPQLIMISH